MDLVKPLLLALFLWPFGLLALERGDTLPALTAEAMSSEEQISLTSEAGLLVVDVWASWCVPCRYSLPAFTELKQQFGDQITVIGLSVDENKDDAIRFAKQHNIELPLLWDKGGEIAALLDIQAMPVTYVLDQQGQLLYRHYGFVKGDENQWRNTLQMLLTQ